MQLHSCSWGVLRGWFEKLLVAAVLLLLAASIWRTMSGSHWHDLALRHIHRELWESGGSGLCGNLGTILPKDTALG